MSFQSSFLCESHQNPVEFIWRLRDVTSQIEVKFSVCSSQSKNPFRPCFTELSHSYSALKKRSVFWELGKRALITVHIITVLNSHAVTQSPIAPLIHLFSTLLAKILPTWIGIYTKPTTCQSQAHLCKPPGETTDPKAYMWALGGPEWWLLSFRLILDTEGNGEQKFTVFLSCPLSLTPDGIIFMSLFQQRFWVIWSSFHWTICGFDTNTKLSSKEVANESHI